MSVDSVLKKEEIHIIRKLSILEVNRIAKNISNKITALFSDHLANFENLFSSISRIDMYIAKMPLGSASAKYLYLNNSIYFNNNIDLSIAENSIFALHECLHFIQTQKNLKGKLTRLGLYEFNNTGLAINEAAVQLMASTAQGLSFDNVKYYDICINTISPDCYPLQCALLSEMLYFTGTYPLYESALNSNDIFKNAFISNSNKKAYIKIEANFDKILKLEDDLYCLSNKLANSCKKREIKSLTNLIANKKNSIKKTFFDTQNLIIQSCFTAAFDNILTLNDVKEFQNKLYNFKDVLCYCDNYNFYNEFYCNAMSALDSIREFIEANGDMTSYRTNNVSLAIIDNSTNLVTFFKKLIQKVKKLFYINNQNPQKIFNNINNK